MKFRIRRTSCKTPPCKKAVLKEDCGYYIEINSLEELITFVNRHHRIILETAKWHHGDNYLEIYDDYRE